MTNSIQVDVLIIGAGPAGLSCAIKLANLAKQQQQPLQICILEKGSEVGAHILSGAVIETTYLDELLPNWQQDPKCPITTKVTNDKLWLLSKTKKFSLPITKELNNQGNYIVSLGQVCKWLAAQASDLGIEIFPGYPAKEILYNEQGCVIGAATPDLGIDKQGNRKSSFQEGMKIYATQTILAEGCRGSLTEDIFAKYQLRKNCQAQTYGLGIKELWEVPATTGAKGTVIHTIGWPLYNLVYGGSFIYYLADNLVSYGLVVGLDYQNPYLNPYQEMQRLKHHPSIIEIFAEGKRLEYGARALNEGGWQAIPEMEFPGGLVIGCAAGLLNIAKIKGTHNAIKSGMLAAESVIAKLSDKSDKKIVNFTDTIKQSAIGKELYRTRNIRPGFKYGLWPGIINAGIDSIIFRGKAPWTLRHSHLSDAEQTKQAKFFQDKDLEYPKPDSKISFDILSSLQLSGVYHEEDQPSHLQLIDKEIPSKCNLELYAGPETRFCPAKVYEYIDGKLKINASNCIHCKTCDIKDVAGNIKWMVPESGGPGYGSM